MAMRRSFILALAGLACGAELPADNPANSLDDRLRCDVRGKSIVSCNVQDAVQGDALRKELVNEHLLLQRKALVQARSQLQAQEASKDEVSEDQGSCLGMRDVERVCSNNGCRVLATRMSGRNCNDYCAKNGRSCVDAAEEVDETCQVKQRIQCHQTWGGTSDLICECSGGGNGGSSKPSGQQHASAQSVHQHQPARNGPHQEQLIWSDEFDGDRVNGSKWSFVVGGGGFGNEELQVYTDQTSNAHVEQGVLKLTARCEDWGSQHYTSAKLQTKHKGDWGPGHRVEVRARLPKGRGSWPAIWMLPTKNSYGQWPKSGEIDIMEAVGCTENRVYGTIHTKAYNHKDHTAKSKSTYTDPSSWHTYSVVWTSAQIQWFVDGHVYHTYTPDGRNSDKWPFDRPFYLILNVAVGGSWGGVCLGRQPSCRSSDEFGRNQVMEVDYARIYALQ